MRSADAWLAVAAALDGPAGGPHGGPSDTRLGAAATGLPFPKVPVPAGCAAAPARLEGPLFCSPLEAGDDGVQAVVQLQARRGQRWTTVVRERATHRGAVALHRQRGAIGAPLDAALQGSHSAHRLLEHLLGVAVRLEDGASSFAQIMEVAELVRNAGQPLGDRRAHGPLAIRDRAEDGHVECAADFTKQVRQVVLTSREQTARAQDLAAEAVAHDPEDLVPDVGLKSIQRQHDAPLSRRHALETFIAGERQGQQFVVPVEEVRDGALTDRNAAPDECRTDLGDASMLAVAKRPDERDHVEAELVSRQREAALLLGVYRHVKSRALGLMATAHLQMQPEEPVQGRDRAMAHVIGAKRVVTCGAAGSQRRQAQRLRRLGAVGSSSHGAALGPRPVVAKPGLPP